MHRLENWQLFAICALTWGTTWYAITFQIGHTAPEVGVAFRFAVAGATVLVLSAVRGLRLRFTRREHALLALQRGFMYGVSYICVYHAERHIVSGLVAVGYSASPLVTGLGGALAVRPGSHLALPAGRGRSSTTSPSAPRRSSTAKWACRTSSRWTA